MEILILLLVPLIFTTAVVKYGACNTALRNILVIIPAIIDLFIVIHLLYFTMSGGEYQVSFIDFGLLSLKFRVDYLTVYMALLVSFLWVLIDVYSFGYMEGREHAITRYSVYLTINITAAMGIIFASNLITFFIFFEMLTFCIYPMVIHTGSKEALRAGVIYMVYLIAGGIALIISILIIYSLTGTLEFVNGGIPALAGQGRATLKVLFILLTFAFGFMSCLVPLHSWLLKAMTAPVPVIALFAAVVVNAGVFGFIRAIYNIFGYALYHDMGFDYVLAILAVITMVYGALQGLRQKDILSLLAMSTINQLSYILIGLAAFTQIGKLGGALHIYYHTVMKITLFFCAGAIITKSRNRNLLKMSGLGKRMPITMACFTIAAIGVIGLPPAAGWISKWYIMQGCFSSSHPFFGIILVLSTIIELGFFAPIVIRAYFQPEEADAFRFEGAASIQGKEVSKMMWMPVIVVTAFSLAFGIWGFVPHWLGRPMLDQLMG